MKDERWMMDDGHRRSGVSWEILKRERPNSSQSLTQTSPFFFPGSASGKQCNVGTLTSNT